MSQSPPTTIGKYQIIREIARSNDIVYEAYDPVMHRRVAIKELAMPKGATEAQRNDRLARFMREARAAGSLVQRNIVTVYEVAEDQGRHYIAMEFLDGQTLRNQMDSEKTVEVGRAVEIAEEVLAGLAFAHGAGVIHRDIKPDNIQILSDGQVKLTDFGIARLTFEPNITSDGQVFGTPSYMAPEQIKGTDLDASSDLFSLGVILYEMLSGKKPFTGDNVVAIAYSIANHTPEPIQSIPGPVWRVIEKSIEKVPSMRFRSATEMSDALKSALQQSQNPIVSQSAASAFQPGAPPPVLLSPQPYTAPHLYGNNYAPSQVPSAGPSGFGQPYNPSGSHTQANMGGTYIPVPVYYPPPPRPPLMSAAAKDTFRRFLWAVGVIGLLFALVIFAIQSLSESLPKSSPKGAANQGQPAIVDPSVGRPLVPDRQAPESRPNSTQGASAEELFRMGVNEISAAMNQRSAEQRQRHWNQSDNYFVEAMSASPRDADAIAETACRRFINACDEMMVSGYGDRAWEALSHAQGFSNGNPLLLDEIRIREAGLSRVL
ncbi:MAG: serine/threonine protein kinase [Fimbriimonadaceae bacterium]|nr:serine/threonine protein kinase [Fimbriimonadaceae bacterium]